jgi:hypothetical protein
VFGVEKILEKKVTLFVNVVTDYKKQMKNGGIKTFISFVLFVRRI